MTQVEESNNQGVNSSEDQRKALQAALFDLVANHFKSLETELAQLGEDFHLEEESIKALTTRFERFQEEMKDPETMADLIRPRFGDTLLAGVQEDPELYTEIIAPIISPAIRSQIRNSRPEIISALSPIMGRAITQAIEDAIGDLRRSIDNRLRRRFNIRDRLRWLWARMRGVSDSDVLLRDLLPYEIQHVFLIHRQTGLLLSHVSGPAYQRDVDLVSAMLTAIRAFARDAFGSQDSDLDEIQFGSSRILLESGLLAYLAVALIGTEPTRYSNKMKAVTNEINVQFEKELRTFDGDMGKTPDFKKYLSLLFKINDDDNLETEITPGQKAALAIGGLGLVFLLAFTAFSCMFAVRLWPVAFPPPTQSPTATTKPRITQTISPTLAITETMIPSATQAPTVTLWPTPTHTVAPTILFEPLEGVMLGNVWVRDNLDDSAQEYAVSVPISTQVEVKAVYGSWAKIGWDSRYGDQEGWVPLRWIGLIEEIPDRIITPMTP